MSITAALNSGTGTLAGTLDRSTNTDGTAQFSDLVINGTAGSFTLRFESGLLQSAMTGPVAISDAPPTKIQLTSQPTGGTLGVVLTPAFTLRLLNAADQPVAAADVSISVALTTGSGGTLAGTLNKSTAADGTVSFSDLIINGIAGSYTLVFSSAPSLTSATSAPVSVTSIPSVCGSSGSGATLTSISRDGGSAAGGVTVQLTGTGFLATDCVDFGSTAATGVTLINSTTLQAIVPPGAVGTVNVKVVQNGVTATLTNGFTYFPTRTTTFATHNFDNGLMAPFATFTGSGAAPSTDVARSGTFSIKATAPANDGNNHQFGFDFSNPKNPPAAEANGVYARWYMYLPPSTLASMATGTVGQIKMHLARYFNGSAWLMCGIGKAFEPGGDVFECVVDNGLFDINPQIKPKLAPDTWHEVQVWYKRDVANSVGLTKTWVNGKLILSTSHPALGSNDLNAVMGMAFGLVFTQLVPGPLIVYSDDVTIANGFIDP